jgi:RNA polymerase-binding protein
MDDGARHELPVEFDRLRAPSSAYAPRQVVTYLCTREHLVSVPFAADAEVPETWDCRCGQPATRVVSADPTATPS